MSVDGRGEHEAYTSMDWDKVHFPWVLTLPTWAKKGVRQDTHVRLKPLGPLASHMKICPLRDFARQSSSLFRASMEWT